MVQSAFEEIYQAHLPSIRLGGMSKPALIVFSAIPGSGKTELTKRLNKNHDVSAMANKDIRKALEKTGHTDDVIIGEYTLWLLDKLTKQKPLTIVFDRNIDQWHKAAKNWAAKNNYRLVLVQIEVSRNTLEKRLHNREGDKVSKVLSMLDFYHKEHDRIVPDMQPDIVLKEDYDLDVTARLIVETVTEGGQ